MKTILCGHPRTNQSWTKQKKVLKKNAPPPKTPIFKFVMIFILVFFSADNSDWFHIWERDVSSFSFVVFVFYLQTYIINSDTRTRNGKNHQDLARSVSHISTVCVYIKMCDYRFWAGKNTHTQHNVSIISNMD